MKARVKEVIILTITIESLMLKKDLKLLAFFISM